MEFHVSLDGEGDLTARVYRSLRGGILEGRLQPGDRLPPTRELAVRLQVSRTTVTTAYERLTAEGFLSARVGAGTFVTDAAPGAPRGSPPQRGALRPRPGWTAAPAPTSGQAGVPRHDFRVGLPDAGLFPFDTWRRLLAAELRLRANHPGAYADPGGHPGLRAAIARHVGYARSVRAHPDDVLVTNGAQQALDLVTRVLVTPGDVVAVEEPGYPPARAVLAAHGARVVGVPVDGEGLVVDRLPGSARLVYTTPSHQFPLGAPMSLTRRTALLAWAQSRGAAVIEDDYDSEFRFSERPLDPLHSLDGSGRVLYVGTFSKTLLPSLRLGFVVAPPTLRSALRAAKQLSDGFAAVAPQAALARFLDDGEFARHVRRAARVYAARRERVVAAVQGPLADLLELVPSSAGLHVCARLRSGDVALVGAVVDAARAEGIAVESLAAYCAEPPAQAGFVLGYGAAPSATLDGALAAFEAVLRRGTSPRRQGQAGR